MYIIKPFFKNKETACLIKADYNICLTDVAEKEIHSWKNIPGQPIAIEVIPCSVDLKLFDPENINTDLQQVLKKDLHISDDDFIISYLGSIGGWYLTKEMMQFCKIVSDKIPWIGRFQHCFLCCSTAKKNCSAYSPTAAIFA